MPSEVKKLIRRTLRRIDNRIFRKIQYRILRPYGIKCIRKNGFWYVDIPRTASSSLRFELSQIYGKPYGKRHTGEVQYNQPEIFPIHVPAKTMKKILGPGLWDSIFTFTFVRNPWDRVVSLYYFRKKLGHLPRDMTFRDYILELKRSERGTVGTCFSQPAYYYGCADYILDEDDAILVTFVGKYENRDADLQKIGRVLGCGEMGKVHIIRAKPEDRHYSQFYDRQTRDIIHDLYRKDVELFGYEFETGP